MVATAIPQMNILIPIEDRVHTYYHRDDSNCATTTLKILSEHFTIPLHSQVIDAALGMHGAGGHGAQCGLVEGALLFIGIFGRSKGVVDEKIIDRCKNFAQGFEARFSSLACRELRPEGFSPENPPHLCEPLTCKAIHFAIEFLAGSEISSSEQYGKVHRCF